jgi:phosphoribosyl-ATP pyrophosphohydrolase
VSDQQTVFSQLMAVIEDRKKRRPPGSHTVKLLDGGVDEIGAKVREEAAELVEAARTADDDAGTAVVYEAADLIYHLLVVLGYCGVRLADVEAELTRRLGRFGLDEKASRRRPGRQP